MDKVAIIIFADPEQKEGRARAEHGLVYAKALADNKKQVKLLFDGAGVMIISKVGGKDKDLSNLFAELNIDIYSDSKITASACKACAEAMGVSEADAKKAGFELEREYHNHPDISRLIDDGFILITL